MNIWCRRELLQVVYLLLWFTHINEFWVPPPFIPSHTGCLIAICFCKNVVHGKLYRFGLRCVPQACKGLIHTHLSTLVLVFAVPFFILLVHLKDKVTACHHLSIHLLSPADITGLAMNVWLILHKSNERLLLLQHAVFAQSQGFKKPYMLLLCSWTPFNKTCLFC